MTKINHLWRIMTKAWRLLFKHLSKQDRQSLASENRQTRCGGTHCGTFIVHAPTIVFDDLDEFQPQLKEALRSIKSRNAADIMESSQYARQALDDIARQNAAATIAMRQEGRIQQVTLLSVFTTT